MSSRIALLLAVLLSVGCSDAGIPLTSILPDSAEPVSNAQEAFDYVFSSSEHIRFFSGNGHLHGADDDFVIKLRPDKTATLIELGYAYAKYEGTYTFTAGTRDTAAELTLMLNEYNYEWPAALRIYRDQADLLLVPVRGTVSDDGSDMWLFRQITDDNWRRLY